MSLTHIPRKKIQIVLMVISSLALVMGMTWFIQSITVKANFPDISSAESRYPNIVNSRIDTCSLCHTSAPNLNPYGAAYKAAGRNPAALAAIETLDSDGDGFTNLQEISALYFPGNAADHPPAATATTQPPTPTRTAVPPTATRTPTSVPPTATHTALPPTPTNTATNPPPTVTRTAVPPTATRTAVPPTPTNTATNPPPTPTRTVAPPTATALLPTATLTTVPPTVTHTAPPPTATQTFVPPAATTTASPPPTATSTVPPPPAATHTPLPPTATNTAPPLPTATKVATQAPTSAFTATSTVVAAKDPEPTDDDHERSHAAPTRRPTPTRQPSPPSPCGYYRQDDGSPAQGWSGFSGSDGDRGSLYRKCKPHEDDGQDGVGRLARQVSDFFSQMFGFFR